MWSHQMQTAAKEHFVAIQWIFIKIGLGLRLSSDQSSPQETTHLYACAGSTQRLHIFVLSEDKLQKNRLLSINVLFGKRSRNFYEWPSNKTGCWFYTSDLSVPNGSSHVQKFTKTTKALLKQFALWMGIHIHWLSLHGSAGAKDNCHYKCTQRNSLITPQTWQLEVPYHCGTTIEVNSTLPSTPANHALLDNLLSHKLD